VELESKKQLRADAQTIFASLETQFDLPPLCAGAQSQVCSHIALIVSSREVKPRAPVNEAIEKHRSEILARTDITHERWLREAASLTFYDRLRSSTQPATGARNAEAQGSCLSISGRPR
jgi:hypothetical protein